MRWRGLVLVAGISVGLCAAAEAQSFSPEITKAIQAYRLDAARASAIMKAQSQLTELLTKDPARMKQLEASLKMTAEQQIAAMEKDPAEARILKANGLSARDYFAGLMALRAAAWTVEGQAGPLADLASPGNVSFLKATPKVLERFKQVEAGRSAE